MTSVSAQWDTAGRQACALAQHEVFGGQVLDPAVPPTIVKAARRSGSAVLRHEADHLAAVLKTGRRGTGLGPDLLRHPQHQRLLNRHPGG
jgi:hypothetical protein